MRLPSDPDTLAVMSDREVLDYLDLPFTIRTLPEPAVRAIATRLRDLATRVAKLEEISH